MNKSLYPKVLIVAYNALSDTQNNGKTITAFFKNWDIDNLAQLYFTTDVPDFTICKRFFQIHDFDILKRFFLNKKVQGKKVELSDLSALKHYKSEVKNNVSLKIMRKNVSSIAVEIKELIWRMGDPYTPAVEKFIDDFNPDIVFFQATNAIFSFSIVKLICEKKNIPLVIQFTDDYISPKFSIDPFFWSHVFRLKSCVKKAIAYSNYVIAISDKLAKNYGECFGGNYLVAMNAVGKIDIPQYIPSATKITFIYAGNIGLNRWKTLSLIVRALEDIYNEDGLEGQLLIYSLGELSAKQKKLLNRPPFGFFNGAVGTSQLNAIKAKADVLVHVEAFDKKNRHITKYSISTKIPEYLASGRCIFAVGPPDIASMQYLMENDLGFTLNSNNMKDVKLALKQIIMDENKRAKYAANGILFSELNHNPEVTSARILEIISSAVNKKVD